MFADDEVDDDADKNNEDDNNGLIREAGAQQGVYAVNNECMNSQTDDKPQAVSALSEEQRARIEMNKK